MAEIGYMAADAILEALGAKSGTSPYTAVGKVSRIDGDGTVYVVLDGSSEETPCTTNVTVQVGATVDVSVSHTDTHITGNRTSPATSVEHVAERVADANDFANNLVTEQSVVTEDKITTSVDKVQIGGRNCFYNSNNADLGWQSEGTVIRTRLHMTPAVGEMVGANGFHVPNKGEEYALSVSATVTRKNGYAGKVYLVAYWGEPARVVSGVLAEQGIAFAKWEVEKFGKERTYSIVFDDPNNVKVLAQALGQTHGAGYVYDTVNFEFQCDYGVTASNSAECTIHWAKVERGNKPTDWTPAPEELLLRGDLDISDLSRILSFRTDGAVFQSGLPWGDYWTTRIRLHQRDIDFLVQDQRVFEIGMDTGGETYLSFYDEEHISSPFFKIDGSGLQVGNSDEARRSYVNANGFRTEGTGGTVDVGYTTNGRIDATGAIRSEGFMSAGGFVAARDENAARISYLYPAYLQFRIPYNNGANAEYFNPLWVREGNQYGCGLTVGAGGLTVVGGGEAAGNLYTVLTKSTDNGGEGLSFSNERLYLAADGELHLVSNCDTTANRKDAKLTSAGNFVLPTAGKFYAPVSDSVDKRSRNRLYGFVINDSSNSTSFGGLVSASKVDGYGVGLYTSRTVGGTQRYSTLDLFIDDNGNTRYEVADRTAFRKAIGLDGSDEATWKTLTLDSTSGFSLYDSTENSKIRYRKIGNIVYLRGVLKRSSTATMTGSFCTLPSGYRPAYRNRFPILDWNGILWYLTINGGTVSLSLVSIAGADANNAEIPFNVSFPAD